MYGDIFLSSINYKNIYMELNFIQKKSSKWNKTFNEFFAKYCA